MNWLWIGLGLAAVVLLSWVFASLRDGAFRKSNVLPPSGRATMSDVQRLIRAGQIIHAIRCYREIHQVGLAEAKKAVDALARQIELEQKH